MKKHFLKYLVFVAIIFLIIPISAKATFGDLRYEITSVNVGDSTITFKGWAFIHRTNNYNEVVYNGVQVASGGDHKILMQAFNETTKEVIENIVVLGKSGVSINSSEEHYNFYCELFDTISGRTCNSNNYPSYPSKILGAEISNQCTNGYDGNSDNSETGYCYYEDIAFEITFNVENWENVGENDKISFKIAASNNDFEYKLNNPGNNTYYRNFKSFSYKGELYTIPESIYMPESLISDSQWETDFIIVDTNSFSNSVAVVAKDSMLRKYNSNNMLAYFDHESIGFGHHVYATYPTIESSTGFSNGCTSNVFNLAVGVITGYDFGISDKTENGLCKSFLGSCTGSHNYAIYVDDVNKGWPYQVCPTNDTDSDVVIVRGSHVKVYGNTVFQISVKNKKLCDVTDPDKDSGVLQCNVGKTYNSVCEELTVSTASGAARVRIEQTGTVSSVLTPDSIYAGGGFNLGIMYYNTIKWSYVSGQNIGTDLHNAVVKAMNDKIKDYNSYIAGINITNLKLGGKSFELVKQCTTSNTSKDYYNKELTVSCVFTFPDSYIDLEGNVSYTYDSSLLNINNKYYTPTNYSGIYNISANIVGMDRITESAAKSDSKENGKAWTGDWSDTFTNCEINIYDLIMKNGKYNFIYRPIDIFNPFPSRNAGINWFDWYNITRNRERLKETYSTSNIQYTAVLDNAAIADIKKYNSTHNYLDWDSINEVTYESSFITEKDYIVRGGNQ